MKKLYLHIGMTKTGTSALQRFFANNRERLYEDGIWYPELEAELKVDEKQKIFLGNADFLLKCSVDMEDMSNEQRHFFEDICKKLLSGEKDILLSHEGIYKKDGVVYKNLKDQGFDVKVIICLRRQDLWGESWWNQRVKTVSITENCFDFIQRMDLDYYKIVKGIAAVVGKDNVIVHVYESGDGREENIFTTFLNILGIHNIDKYQKDTYQTNPSLSANFVEIKRIFNSIPNSAAFMDTMKEILEEGKKYALTDEKIMHAPSFLKREERLAILEKYHESNTMLAKEFLGRDTLFDETIEDNDEYGVDYETIYEDIIKFFGMLFVRQYEEIEKIKDVVCKFEIPEECIGKRIVVYGIDGLGNRLYRQLESEEICGELVAVDRRVNYVEELYNVPVVNPETIRYEDIDYVMIAVKNEKTYEVIKSYLINIKKLHHQQIFRMRLSER